MNRRYIILTILIALLAASCTKPYTPKAITSVNNYLVVEGVINTGAGDTTTINLSRTVNLSSGVSSTPETGAVISIQDNQNQSYNLTDVGNGVYRSAALTLDNTRQYRLSIHTSDGKTFLSDYQTTVVTPAIDSVGFMIKSNGMQTYVNTHDPANHTHYYRWDYIETWTFHSEYYSAWQSNGTAIVVRPTDSLVYQCWANNLSDQVLLSSSAKLTQDVIYQFPLTFVASTSEKIESRYSLLVKQYGMTEDAYNYYSELKQNTEELGSIFDAQPTDLTGNVHCTTDATLPVIGYITAGTIQQKRIYINNNQLPYTWVTAYPYTCVQDTALYSNAKTGANDVEDILVPLPNNNIPTLAIYDSHSPNTSIPIGFYYSGIGCVDCSIRGTTTQPSFWIP